MRLLSVSVGHQLFLSPTAKKNIVLNNRFASHFKFYPTSNLSDVLTTNGIFFKLPTEYNRSADGARERLNLCQAINQTLHSALEEDSSAVCFGEDVAFGACRILAFHRHFIFRWCISMHSWTSRKIWCGLDCYLSLNVSTFKFRKTAWYYENT